MASKPRVLPDPELTRSAYPELTRCDHCGALDERTRPLLAFKRQPEGDGWSWLHPECRDAFEPVLTLPFERLSDVVKRVVPEWAKGERKTPAPPRSDIRRRVAARDYDRPPFVRLCGGKYWCACDLADPNRHQYRWEFFVEIDSDGQWKRVMERAPADKIICAYCRKDDGVIQFACIGSPGQKVVEVYLHQACERGYLRLIDEPAS